MLKDKSFDEIPKEAVPELIAELMAEMKQASARLEFERAALLRDMIFELEKQIDKPSKLRSYKHAKGKPNH